MVVSIIAFKMMTFSKTTLDIMTLCSMTLTMAIIITTIKHSIQ
jgi:hypothetical protein